MYIADSIRSNTQFTVNQVSIFCNNLKLNYAKAMKRIERCLKRVKDKGIIFSSNDSLGFKDWTDADFTGG